MGLTGVPKRVRVVRDPTPAPQAPEPVEAPETEPEPVKVGA
jgi:hypothetical protein